ncbi:hypothetical protein UPYG_G00023000 [Umbra pygmaea]|uniref:Uncharacterized protein n=1 Tax=Umbra pygmaea TaxID=75934 RepID=A0ABD0XL95_UMBPY
MHPVFPLPESKQWGASGLVEDTEDPHYTNAKKAAPSDKNWILQRQDFQPPHFRCRASVSSMDSKFTVDDNTFTQAKWDTLICLSPGISLQNNSVPATVSRASLGQTHLEHYRVPAPVH